MRTKRSATMRPPLTSCIDALLEWFDADPLDSREENFIGPLAQLEIGRNDILDHIGHVCIGHGRPDQRAERRVLIGAAADRHLKIFFAILLDAEKADMADVMMAAGVDAAGNVDVQPPEIAREVEIAEAASQLLRHRNRAR